jgi:ABC-2 type transport system ATP-binding protein
MDSLVSANKINHYYGSFHAVQDLSLKLGRGEILGLLGPNGAGKSTSMEIISGNVSPSSGSVQLNGEDLQRNPQQAKASLGYLPEQPPLYRNMTIEEYLGFCAKLHGIVKSKIPSAISEAVEKCGLTDMEKRLIGNLSKGYQQRVGIAQAIIHRPSIIILDEPTSGLDPNQIIEIRNLISELGSAHGVILSTHILSEVQSLCSRVLILNKGRIVFSENIANIDDSSPSALLIRLERPPELNALQSIQGISDANNTNEGYIRVELDATTTLSAISEQIVNSGWGLMELTPEQNSLEQIFTRLTMDEEDCV